MKPLKDYLVKGIVALSLVGMLSGCYQDIANYYQKKLEKSCEDKWKPNVFNGQSDPELLSYLCCKNQTNEDEKSVEIRSQFPDETLELICEDGEAKELISKDNEGAVMIQRMKDGKIHGLQEGWYDSGELEFQETYINGKREGEAKEWYKNGELNELAIWENGEQKKVTTFWENGQIQHQREVKDGRYHGEVKNWSQKGILFRDEVYENGGKILISSD
jgi:hypothetical protein